MDWFSSHVLAWSACLWCLCTVVAMVRATCPENAMGKAMGCTSRLGLGVPDTLDNAFVEKGHVALAKQACRDNSLKDVVTCLEEITEACQGNSDQEHFLRNMVDVEKVRKFVTFFCSHLNEYEKYAPCIGRNHATLTQCVHQQRKTMVTKVKASINMDYLMTSTCKYFYAAEVCTQRVLSESCGSSAADMVARVFSGFKPPICYSVQGAQSDTSGSSGSRSSMVEAMWFGILLAILIYCVN